jgi:hypothetical protein
MIAGSTRGRRWEFPKNPAAKLASGRIQQISSRIEAWIEERPVTCLAGAMLLGVTIGWLVKRR